MRIIGTIATGVCALGMLAGAALFTRSIPEIRRYLETRSM
jgi:hypothetical protein